MSHSERAPWRAALEAALARYHSLPRAGGDAWAILEGKLATALTRQRALTERLALADDEGLLEDLLAVGLKLTDPQKKAAKARLGADDYAALLAAQGERVPKGSAFDRRAGPAIDLKIKVNRDSPWPFERWRMTPEFADYEIDGERVFYRGLWLQPGDLLLPNVNHVARIIYAAATNTTEPLAKQPLNAGRIGSSVTLGTDYTDPSATRQAKGDALVNAIFDARIAMEKKDVPTDNLYAVFGPEDYYAITMSSRAINTDFNSGGGNGTIADGKTMMVAGIPLYSSNHVTQPAYSLVPGDCNAEYAQDLSNCKGLVFHRDCCGVLTLLSPALQVTSGDWNISHQSTLLLARQSIGMGVLRAECAVDISV